ncbi:hypothetical protein THAOC_29503 [Thalassiosira oceanica]|uniref:Uncharacterized protein n=1 Tax=Thalassiosira oceanica TaxID=159749 RepID=K0RX82_THAOC|nr:hypothetical protein THAOC_29503 [Thalassiosira oceanica]|eukprot:EJK51332.1 hypothetical protein THAOC_29503 [Thalassiosira oceanica]
MISWRRFRSGPVIIANEAKRCLGEACFVRTVGSDREWRGQEKKAPWVVSTRDTPPGISPIVDARFLILRSTGISSPYPVRGRRGPVRLSVASSTLLRRISRSGHYADAGERALMAGIKREQVFGDERRCRATDRRRGYSSASLCDIGSRERVYAVSPSSMVECSFNSVEKCLFTYARLLIKS